MYENEDVITGRVVTKKGIPIPDVMVNNLTNVTTTDADGEFRIARSEFVSISIPRGYTTKTWWARPEDTHVPDFVLEPQEQSLPIRLLHATDLHVTGSNGRAAEVGAAEPPQAHQAAALLADSVRAHGPFHAALLTGDLVDVGTPEEYRAFLTILEGSDLPVLPLPGNADHKTGDRHALSLTDTDYLINGVSSALWEDHVGPRWYSRDIADLHIVAMDWNTWERRVDRDRQNRWIRNDLTATGNRPWILLAHDVPNQIFFEQLPSQPLAVLTGHWHTDRVTTHRGVKFINTPSALYAGLDHSAPSVRIITWDAAGIHASDIVAAERRATSASPGQWRTRLAGSGRIAGGPVVADDRVVLAGVGRTAGTGRVSAFDISSGAELWTTDLANPVAAAPVMTGEALVVHDVTGAAVGIDPVDGSVLWADESEDPLRDWVMARPVAASSRVIVGYPGTLRCLDPRTGERLWTYPRQWPHFNIVPHAGITSTGSQLLIGAAPLRPALTALTATGHAIWQLDSPFVAGDSRKTPHPPIDTSSQRSQAADHLDALGWSPTGPGAHHPSGITVFPASRHVYAVDASGNVRWDVAVESVHGAGAPAIFHDTAIIVASDRLLRSIRVSDGTTVWERRFDTDALEPHIPMRGRPHGPLLGGPSVTSEQVIVPGMDGNIHILDAATGTQVQTHHVGSAVLARPLATDSLILASSTNGDLVAIPRDQGRIMTPSQSPSERPNNER